MTTPIEPSGPWIAVVGTREDGRAEVMRRLLDGLAKAGAMVGGFLQRPCFDGDAITGYDLVHAVSGERMPLARESADPEMCAWGFSQGAFTRGRSWALEGPHEVAFVEVGRLEAAGRGHWQTLVESLESPRLTIVCVRRAVLTSVALRLPDPVDGLVLPAEAPQIDDFIARVVERHAQQGRA